MLVRGVRQAWPQLRQACMFARQIHWPACPDPSPYQIFGLDAGAAVIDKKKLRHSYYELVKQYHPDRGESGDAERFKRVVEAHEILRNDSKRQSYNASHPTFTTPAGDVRYTRTHHFEDDMDVNYWSNDYQQKFDAGMHESRMWVLKCVVFMTVAIAIANFLMLKEAAETRAELLDAQTERVAAQLAHARANRYPDDSPQDVIDRFVATRQRAIDKYGKHISYNAIRNGGPDEAVLGPQAAPAPAAPPTPRANGQHEGPVASYFGR